MVEIDAHEFNDRAIWYNNLYEIITEMGYYLPQRKSFRNCMTAQILIKIGNGEVKCPKKS